MELEVDQYVQQRIQEIKAAQIIQTAPQKALEITSETPTLPAVITKNSVEASNKKTESE